MRYQNIMTDHTIEAIADEIEALYEIFQSEYADAKNIADTWLRNQRLYRLQDDLNAAADAVCVAHGVTPDEYSLALSLRFASKNP